MEFYRKLAKLDRKPYHRARELEGDYKLEDFEMSIISSPKDPYLPPGRMSISIPSKKLGYPEKIMKFPVLVAHFLNKKLSEMNSRNLKIYRPTNIVIERSSAIVKKKAVFEFDFYVPFRARKIDAQGMKDMLSGMASAFRSLEWKRLEDRELLKKMAMVYEDQLAIRKRMKKEGIAAFVANGSVLPREPFRRKPMKGAVPFTTKDATAIEGVHQVYEGLAIEKGKMTVITGMNFQGKSTLLDAISTSFYNHEYGDGREFVLGEEMAVANKESHRKICCDDLSMFLKGGEEFCTGNASGSVSQMANVSEALKAGKGILIDEDDSAINFLIPRAIMHKGKQIIKPLSESMPSGTVIMVSGALKEFVDMADRVIVMEEFVPSETRSKAGAKRADVKPKKCRIKLGRSKASRADKHRIEIGQKFIDLSGPISRTIYERAQVYLIADMLSLAKGMEGDAWEIAGALFEKLKSKGFSATGRHGNYTMITRYQLYYAISRHPYSRKA